MILALDLSTACTGWALYNTDGALIDFGRIIPNDKDHNFLKIKFIVEKLKVLFKDSHQLIVEGIFLNTFMGQRGQATHNVTGFELLARLSGAVINSYLQTRDNLPTIYKAVEARKLVGIKGSCQKAEVQIWVLRNYRVNQNITTEELDNWDCLIEAEYASFNAKEMVKSTFKSHMEKISKTIEEETGIGEDVADSILLGRSWFNDTSRNNK